MKRTVRRGRSPSPTPRKKTPSRMVGGKGRWTERARESEDPWARVARTPRLEGTGAVPGTTPHGARDCFLELRGVWRVRIRHYPPGMREPLRVLKLHNWLAPVSPLNPKGDSHATSGARQTAGPSPPPWTPAAGITHTSPGGTGCRPPPGGRHPHTQTHARPHAHARGHPRGRGRAAQGEPWSTSCRPVTSNISRPRRFSCSHTGEICVNLPPNSLAMS